MISNIVLYLVKRENV